MKLIFAGTPDFAVPSLEAVIAAGHEVVAVYTQPDRPAGRGRQSRPSPVKACAEAHHLPVLQPPSLKNEAARLADFQADAMIVVAYGLLLPAAILAIPKYGCINVHASLLPRWRGAAPIQRAIEAGDHETGVSIMQMDVGLDTGDILMTRHTAITEHDNGGSLHDRLARLGAESLIETLLHLEKGGIKPRPQDGALATYARKLSKSESEIDWCLSAEQLACKIRAFNPWPGAVCRWQGKPLRLLHATARKYDDGKPPGYVITADAGGLVVATGAGALIIERLQLAGGKPQRVSDFLNGHALAAGTVLH